MRRIGIIGCCSHDVILLLAKAVRCLGERVILTDRNEARVLSACVPLPEEWETEPYTEYKGMFFSKEPQKKTWRNVPGVEFVDFGFGSQKAEWDLCEDLIVICDMHPHHMKKINDAQFPREKVRLCLLRDVIPELLNREKDVREFLDGLKAELRITLFPDHKDVKNRYVCELHHEYSLKNASAEMREAILQTVCLLFPGTEEKELRRRIRLEERREYR